MMISKVILPILAALTMTLGCTQDAAKEDAMPKKSIETVLKEHTDDLMALPGVVGTAQSLCKGQPCIKIYVSEMTDELQQKLPKTLEGYLVDVEVTGEFRALPKK